MQISSFFETRCWPQRCCQSTISREFYSKRVRLTIEGLARAPILDSKLVTILLFDDYAQSQDAIGRF